MADLHHAAVMEAPHRPIALRELAAPALAPGEVLLETIASEVCGTDVHLRHGRLSGVPYPIIPGHVSVGRVAAVRAHPGYVSGEPVREGDVVTFLDVHGTCHACYQCLVARQATRCPSRRVYGITYGVADGLTGGWATAVHLKAGVHLLRLPESVGADMFIAGGCGLVTAVHAVERGRVALGERVAVLGVGPVGLSAIALARRAGAVDVVAIGGPAHRLAFARRMGATATIPLELPPDARRDALLERMPHGADVVIEAAGAAEALAQACALVRDGGRVVVAGFYTDAGESAINAHRLINRKHAEILGCWGSSYAHLARAVDVLAAFGDDAPWADMVTHRFRLDEADIALDVVARGESIKALMLPQVRAAAQPRAG